MTRLQALALLTLLAAVSPCVPARAQGPQDAGATINETFEDSAAAVAHLGLKADVWDVSGGVLRTRNVGKGMATFGFGHDDWGDYRIEFRVKRLALTADDQHFGLILRQSPQGSLRFYCRGDSIIVLEEASGREMRHDALARLSQPLGVGEAAAWTTFGIHCSGSEARVYENGTLLGTLSGIVPRHGTGQFYAYQVELLLDDLKISGGGAPVAGGAPAAPNGTALDTPNLVANSSFEYCTERGLADYWGCPHWGLMDVYWILHLDEWHRCFGVDDTTAYAGKRSFRVSNHGEQSGDILANGGLTLWSCCAGTAPGEPYALSAYMKGEPAGMKVSFGGQQLTLTGTWQRYTVPFVRIDGNSPYEDMIRVYPASTGTFWIDAVQLEKGKVASPYTPSPKDAFLGTPSGGPGQTRPMPRLKLPRLEASPVLDGNIGEACWAKAARVALSLTDGRAPQEPTSVAMFYTSKGLYLGFRCQDKEAANQTCRETRRDANVWNDPSIEIFLDPRLTRSHYYHLALNQRGVQYDAANVDDSWNGRWQAATRTESGAWFAEVFLPFSDFDLDWTTGEWWGINLCRENHRAQEESSWSPTYGGFHTPDRFGQIGLDAATLNPYLHHRSDQGGAVSAGAPSAAGAMVKVAGKPFLPFGFYWEGPTPPELFDYLARNGFNVVCFGAPQSGDPRATLANLDAAAKAGLKVVIEVQTQGAAKERAAALIRACRQHPALLGWCLFDEVFTTTWGKENYQAVCDTCREMKQLDPDHIVCLVENEYGLGYLKGKNLDFPGDAVWIDYYAYPPSGNLGATTDHMKTMAAMATKSHQPCWFCPLGGGYAFWASREYTPAEEEYSTYTGLINGTTGFFYFASHPRSPSLWAKLRQLAQEARTLTPVLATGTAQRGVECSGGAIQYLAQRCGEQLYLIAVNGSAQPTRARFNLGALTQAGPSAKVEFENRRIAVTGGLLEDGFAGYQRHVYVLPLRK